MATKFLTAVLYTHVTSNMPHPANVVPITLLYPDGSTCQGTAYFRSATFKEVGTTRIIICETRRQAWSVRLTNIFKRNRTNDAPATER